jgi:WD40 repeat protein
MATPDIHLNAGGVEMSLSQKIPITGDTCLSPDGRYLLTTDMKNGVKQWDIKTGVQVGMFQTELMPGPLGLPLAPLVTFTPDGKYALTLGKHISIWDVSSGMELKKTLDVVHVLSTWHVRHMFISSDGRRLIVLLWNSNPYAFGNQSAVAVYDTTSWQELYRHTFGANYNRIALSPDGRYALLADYNVAVLDIATGEVISVRKNIGGAIKGHSAVAFSPDGKKVVYGGTDGVIRVYELFSNTDLIKVKAHRGAFPIYGDFAGAGITNVSFSPDGRYVLSSGGDGFLKLWDAASGAEIRSFKIYGTVTMQRLFFSPDSSRIIRVNGFDASVSILNTSNGEELAMLIGFLDGEWLSVVKEGYYNASEKGAQFLKVKYEGIDYGVDQFYDVFYRPDIVSAKLSGQDISGLISITMTDASKSPPPSVEFTTMPFDTNQSKVKVCYEAKSAGGGIGEVRLFHNGKLVESDGYYKDMAKAGTENMKLLALNSQSIYENMRSVRIHGTQESAPVAAGKAKGELFQDCKDIDVVPGENDIGVTAFNRENTIQGAMKTAKFNANVPSEDPRLYIVSIGIDTYEDSTISLKYAAKDARDMEQKLIEEARTLYKPQNIHYELLTDKGATKPAIITKIDDLANIVKPGDSFILFVAGHGVLLQNQYYMLTHDYNGTVTSQSMISSNELIELSKKIKSLSQLLIFDTCHAGGVDAIVSGLYDARMSVLAKKMGLHIYASASTKEAAMDGYQGNGLFTHALLEGLDNKKEADTNNDGKISVVELGDYAKQETITTSRKAGYQQTPLIINFGKDSPVYQLR